MSINKVILVGHAGQDPEVRALSAEYNVARFTLATTNRGYITRDGRKVEDSTEWHNISVGGALCKVAADYIRKGDKVYIEGELHTRQYDNARGERCYFTEVVAHALELMSARARTASASADADPLPWEGQR